MLLLEPLTTPGLSRDAIVNKKKSARGPAGFVQDLKKGKTRVRVTARSRAKIKAEGGVVKKKKEKETREREADRRSDVSPRHVASGPGAR